MGLGMRHPQTKAKFDAMCMTIRRNYHISEHMPGNLAEHYQGNRGRQARPGNWLNQLQITDGTAPQQSSSSSGPSIYMVGSGSYPTTWDSQGGGSSGQYAYPATQDNDGSDS